MTPHQFYQSTLGDHIAETLRSKFGEIWTNDDIKDRTLACLGYTAPYQGLYLDHARHVFSLNAQNCAADHHNFAYSQFEQLPLSAESVNRVLMCHAFDDETNPLYCLAELWRVLKPGGRVICVFANINSQWADANNGPFRHEFSTTLKQAQRLFEQLQFDVVSSHEAVFMPPYETPLNLKLSGLYEGVGKYVSFIPAVGGVHVIEAEKSIRQPVMKGNAPVTDALVGKILKPKAV